MNNREKIKIYKELLENPRRLYKDEQYQDVLFKTGDDVHNYSDYMITSPINVEEELKRIDNADYELCCALMTLLIREEYWRSGTFDKRFDEGKPQAILERIIKLLDE